MGKIIENFCLTFDQSENAKKKFLASFSGREGRFQKELTKVNHILNNEKLISISEYPQLSILSGLELLFNRRQSPLKFPANYYHFEFFTHLYNLTYDSLSNAGKNALEGRIIAGIKDNRHLISLFLELIVKEFYCSNKCDVSFNEINIGTKETYDLNVDKSNQTYAVEIKTVSIDSGLPMEPEWIGQCLYWINERYSDAERNGGALQIDVTFKGDRSLPHANIKNSIHLLLDKLQKREGFVSNKDFDIIVNKISLNKHHKNEQKFQETFYQAAKNNLNLIRQGFSPLNQLPTCLSFFAHKKWKLPEKITAVIKNAVNEQLPKKGMSVLWISVIGLTAFVDNPEFVLDDISSADNVFYKELEKRKYKYEVDSGLIGMHFMGDVTTVINGENTMLLKFPAKFIAVKENTPEANMYLMTAVGLAVQELPHDY